MKLYDFTESSYLASLFSLMREFMIGKDCAGVWNRNEIDLHDSSSSPSKYFHAWCEWIKAQFLSMRHRAIQLFGHWHQFSLVFFLFFKWEQEMDYYDAYARGRDMWPIYLYSKSHFSKPLSYGKITYFFHGTLKNQLFESVFL